MNYSPVQNAVIRIDFLYNQTKIIFYLFQIIQIFKKEMTIMRHPLQLFKV